MLSLHRSLSLSSNSSAKSNATLRPDPSEEADSLTELRQPFPSVDFTAPTLQPSWMQELMQSGSSRHSRASSIVSTRTGFSTTTIDDARADTKSIDINVGGQYFRISRDGSRINDDQPPPYSGPRSIHRLRSPEPPRSRSPSTSVFHNRSRSSSTIGIHDGESTYESGTDGTAMQIAQANASTTIADSVEYVTLSSIGRPLSDERPDPSLSYGAGLESFPVVQQSSRLRTTSQDSGLPTTSTIPSHLRTRNGARLPTIATGPSHLNSTSSVSQTPMMQSRSASTSTIALRSAEPVLMSTFDMDIPGSPTFIGRHANAPFPPPSSSHDPTHNISESSTKSLVPASSIDSGDEGATPPAMDTENDISLHYARQMRQLDREHRKALHLRDKELEKLRERLNEVDTVYRQELRARDFMVDDLKKRLEHLEETQEARIEKARNQVEDIWESRWKHRDSQLLARMKRIEEESHRSQTHAR